MKRLLIAALLCATALLLLISGIQSPAFDAFLARRVSALASGAGAWVRFRSFDFDLFGPEVRCKGLAVEASDGTWTASAERASVRLHLLRSLGGTPHLSLEAEAPVFRGTVRLKGEEHKFELPKIVLERLRITRGAVAVKAAEFDLSARVPSVEVSWSDGAGQGSLTGGGISWQGEEEPLRRVTFSGFQRLGILHLERLSLESRRITVDSTGRKGLKGLVEGSVSARVALEELPKAWIQAARLARYAPIEGALALRGRVTGTLEEPRFHGRGAVSAGRFGPLSFEGAGFDVGADADGLSFRELWARSSAGSAAHVRGSLTWKDGVRLEARGETPEYRLRPFMALFVDDYFPVGLTASGRFEAVGPLYPKIALACRVDASGRDLDVTTDDEEGRHTWFSLPTGKVSARCVVGEDELVLGPTEVQSPSASVRIPKGRIDYREGLDFETDLELRDLSLVRQYVPKGMDARGRARGRFGGPYKALTFHYALDLPSTTIFREEAGRFRGRADFDLRDLVLRDGLLTGPFGTLRAAGRATLRPGGALGVRAEWTGGDLARLSQAARRSSPELPEVSRGTASATGEVVGKVDAPVFEGFVRTEGVRIGRAELDSVSAEGSFGLRAWQIRRARVDAWGAAMEATGFGDGAGFRASGAVRSLSLPRLGSLAGKELPVDGLFEGEFEAQGPYRDPTARLAGRVARLSAEGLPVGDARVAATLAGRELRAEATAFSGGATATGSLTLGDRFPFGGEITVRDLPWAVLPEKLRPGGLQVRTVSGRGSANGFLSAPELSSARWEGVVEGVRAAQLDVGRVRLVAAYGTSGLTFSASAWRSEASLEGSLPRGSEKLALRFSADGLDLARLVAVTGIGAGHLSAAGRAVADLDRLRSASGGERLRALAEISGEGRLTRVLLPRDAGLPEASFRVETRDGLPELEALSGGIRVTARLEDWKSLGWKATAELRDVNPAEYFRPGSPVAAVQGTVSAAAIVEGEGALLRGGRAEGSLKEFALDPAARSEWTWTAELRGEAAVFSAREPRGVDLSGSWSRRAGLAVHATLRDAPLQGWATERLLPADFRGVARGEVELALPPSGPPAADARLERLSLALPPVKAESVGPVTLSLRNGELRLGTVTLKGDDFQVDLSGRLSPGSNWDLKVKGKSGLALARRMIPLIQEASGAAFADVTIRGPWKAPAIEGPVQIADGARLVLEGLDLPLSDVSASGYLDARRGLAVERVEARLGEEGRFRAEGLVGIQGLQVKDFRLFVEGRDITYERPKQVTYRFDTDLVASGTLDRPELRGEVRLKNLLYGRRLNWKTMVLDFLNRRPRSVERRASENGLFVDLAVLGSQDLKVENNLADLELGVDLRARGYFPDPFLWGRVEILNGDLRFRSQRYEALRSTVEFLGETQPIPLLDLHARSTVGQYAVTVDVSGPLDKYQVNLASVPPLPQTELVALLTVGGAPTERVSAATTLTGAPLKESVTSQTITAAEATSFLTGRIQDLLESEVSDLLGFEQFHIDPSYSTVAQTSVPKVTVGKTLTQDLSARYSAALGAQTEQDVELQYTVSPRVQLLGTWSDKSSQTKGSLGGEVRFRFTFR